jgi:hypothetical protein
VATSNINNEMKTLAPHCTQLSRHCVQYRNIFLTKKYSGGSELYCFFKQFDYDCKDVCPYYKIGNWTTVDYPLGKLMTVLALRHSHFWQ